MFHSEQLPIRIFMWIMLDDEYIRENEVIISMTNIYRTIVAISTGPFV